MTVERSKRRSLLALTFIAKSASKNLLIRILKCQNQLHLLRRLEQCSIKQVSCETAIEFLKLCQNLELTPTFAKVNKTKAEKWKGSAKDLWRECGCGRIMPESKTDDRAKGRDQWKPWKMLATSLCLHSKNHRHSSQRVIRWIDEWSHKEDLKASLEQHWRWWTYH